MEQVRDREPTLSDDIILRDIEIRSLKKTLNAINNRSFRIFYSMAIFEAYLDPFDSNPTGSGIQHTVYSGPSEDGKYRHYIVYFGSGRQLNAFVRKNPDRPGRLYRGKL
jgi:hypothetical protein